MSAWSRIEGHGTRHTRIGPGKDVSGVCQPEYAFSSEKETVACADQIGRLEGGCLAVLDGDVSISEVIVR